MYVSQSCIYCDFSKVAQTKIIRHTLVLTDVDMHIHKNNSPHTVTDWCWHAYTHKWSANTLLPTDVHMHIHKNIYTKTYACEHALAVCDELCLLVAHVATNGCSHAYVFVYTKTIHRTLLPTGVDMHIRTNGSLTHCYQRMLTCIYTRTIRRTQLLTGVDMHIRTRAHTHQHTPTHTNTHPHTHSPYHAGHVQGRRETRKLRAPKSFGLINTYHTYYM